MTSPGAVSTVSTVGTVGTDDSARTSRASGGRWLAVPVLLGLIVLVGGTFLPWLRSGSVERNSYAADGAARRILHLDGPIGALLAAWPFLGLVCGVAAALLVLGRTRTGAALAAAGALAAGAVSVAVLSTTPGVLIRPASAGPVSTLAGSALVVASVLLYFVAVIIGASPLTSSARRLR